MLSLNHTVFPIMNSCKQVCMATDRAKTIHKCQCYLYNGGYITEHTCALTIKVLQLMILNLRDWHIYWIDLWVVCSITKMKYSLQLLYIVLAIYLTFVTWSVDADPVCHTLFICYLSKTCFFYFSVIVCAMTVVLVAQEALLVVCWFSWNIFYLNVVLLNILNCTDHIHVVDTVLLL